MTREEAIQVLKEHKKEYFHTSRIEVAIDLAIKSLSADTVSRSQYQGLLNAIGKVYVEVVRCKDCRWWNSETKGCKRNPSVEPWREDDFCKYGKRWSNAID